MRVAICPASFDPVTRGHVDIIERAAGIFDRVLAVVFHNAAKRPLFPVDERVEMVTAAVAHLPNVEVDHADGLLVHYAQRREARVIVKGLRAITDFEYEFQMALMNKKLDPGVETLFIMTSSAYSYLSSSVVKEVARWGGCVEDLVPPGVGERLRGRLLGPNGQPLRDLPPLRGPGDWETG
ncbi:MAG: pantetheine-phosphate adenylyltransferase [bacterium]|nr:pantetheine-phosphate adenylyltransferase [bacterium]